ncbi:MAG: DUF177 domain-containing protein [Lactobacillus sp.]|uniref:Uncharacterized protein n=1 Tax=Bombilactobacillus bombi TaxID=1303590 RepID=A0A347SQI7_9LACO|nr:YceD family protein [Bombilactobacillus bombi]AXX64296.1 DUF177 domain-containing protein [Bombilactobacillus bombi]MCO6541702.1 DUF177 domain-containing protein [Lactobacillus sp.]MCO6543082.1 DUF177 domain-containing protein [Lactobacillus sp.]RHW49594.1 hypothetical protein DS831_05355 [Bombilactobacillus bombi]
MLVYTTAQLEKYRKHPLTIQQTLNLEKDLQQRDAQIIAVKPVTVNGTLGWEKGLIYSQLSIKTQLTYPSTRSFEPVVLPINIDVQEFYSSDLNTNNDTDSQPEELIIPLENEQLDLQSAIEDNILLSIPSQVLTTEEQAKGTMPSGKEWTVISEDQYQKNRKQAGNSQWDKLKELLPPDDE